MTLGYVLMQNLRRNPRRTALTMTAFALPMAVFVTAMSLVLALVEVNRVNARELRMAVQNKIALVNALPERLRREIEALDPDRLRMQAVCGFRWFGGRVPGAQNLVQSFGVDADTYPIVFSDLDWTDAEREAWLRERRACVVGSSVAEQYGWKVGDRITLESTVPPYLSLEFVVVKITPHTGRTNSLRLRRDYFEESRRSAGFDNPGCNIFWLRCQSPAAMASLQQEIDSRFANTPNETRSMDENTFGAQFVEAAGDLPGLMQAMALVVVFIIALVAGNTMMMSFRERTGELAVFKAIGFPSGRVFRAVLAESLLLALLGAIAGVLPAALLLGLFPVHRWLHFLPIANLEISPAAVLTSLLIALLVGLAAGLWPAVQAVRLRTVDALRRVA
jgi:putative ABC transport system permease protein